VAEALLLSMALADRINIIEQEKREAQAATIAALEANEAIIKQQNETLEDRVRDRTKELAEVNAELSTLNEELSQTNEELSSTLHLAEQQRRQLSEKNIEITASISYAKRIQESILPDFNYIRQWLPQHFILFKPRDIVSGDFYFFLETDKVKFLAAIDCTGHGVPGAFMSLVANDLLNDIILTQHLCRPDLILNALHLGIRKLLKQEETQNRDGMDMALLAIDETHQKVQFAGARNPLWYVSDGQLTEIKGDRMSIGGEQREQERKYTNHLIALEQLNSTTSFYLFSDGFQDQFGGLAGKKFGKTQLRDLLVKIYRQPLDEQRQVLLESFEHWIYEAQEKQIDDMLFIGLRLK
jgi:serine phosphatase RsbU (regulator of sigma subunit)